MAHFVYILASFRGAIYTGSTNHLVRRLEQYCSRAAKSFSSTYKTTKLVYVEAADSAEVALARERQIKGWRRDRKVELIESINPYWEDLSSQVLD